MAKTMNRNAQRSHRLLEEAFVRLLAEKPYERITVSDVTRAAGLNRGTFYAHFNSMAELFEDVRGTFSKALTALVRQVMTPTFVEDPMPVLSEIGAFLSENRDRIIAIVGANSASAFVGSLEQGVKEQVREQLLGSYGGEDATGALVVADYLAGGALRAYAAWLEGDYGGVPIDDVNRRLVPLVKSTCAVYLASVPRALAVRGGDAGDAGAAAAASPDSAGAAAAAS